MKFKDIQTVLGRIENSSVIAMGRRLESHPKYYYSDTILISPITTRPYYKNISTKIHRVSATLDFIKHIIRKSKLKGTEEQNEKNITFINKCLFDMIKGGSHKKGETRIQNIIGGSVSEAILKLLGSKKGLIRNQLLGHRSLNGSRITISGNTRMEINEVGIPLYVVKILQVAETVRDYNIKRLLLDINTGRASRIKKLSTGFEQAINSRNQNLIILEYGDVVYRYVRHTDMVNFNRAPSLKESAIGSHKPIPFEYEDEHTFQINVSVCANYNADFDGDQMRLKILRTPKAIAEALFISNVERWMLSAQNATAINGQVQDAVLSSALLTKGLC